MPIQAPQWTDYLNCPVCCREFGAPPRSPVSLGCGHTLCRHCLNHLHKKQCPFDQTLIQVDPDELVVNTALLQLAGYSPPPQPYHPPCIQALSERDRCAYDVVVKCMEYLAVCLKYSGNASNNLSGSRLSRPMQRKLVTLLQCAVSDEEGRGRAARAARSLGERTVTELILQHQNPQQISAYLWAAVRSRGCQFLGPAMQEEVLKLVLLALEDGSALSRKVLVMFVVQRLKPHFPQASKTSIGHVVQLLYRASCFKVSKRECDSSLMQLKEEFRTYESLRREHDAQIVQIATESGLRIAPDQWSALLYGDTAHKSHMQSIIDKLQTPQSFAQSVQELFVALQRTGDPAQLVVISMHLERLAGIDASPDAKSPSWQQLAEIMSSLQEVVLGLFHQLQQQAAGRDNNHNHKPDRNSDPSSSQPSPQTVSSTPTQNNFDAARQFVPRTAAALSTTDEELERLRWITAPNMSNGNYTYSNIPQQPLPMVPMMRPQLPMPNMALPPPTVIVPQPRMAVPQLMNIPPQGVFRYRMQPPPVRFDNNRLTPPPAMPEILQRTLMEEDSMHARSFIPIPERRLYQRYGVEEQGGQFLAAGFQAPPMNSLSPYNQEIMPREHGTGSPYTLQAGTTEILPDYGNQGYPAGTMPTATWPQSNEIYYFNQMRNQLSAVPGTSKHVYNATGIRNSGVNPPQASNRADDGRSKSWSKVAQNPGATYQVAYTTTSGGGGLSGRTMGATRSKQELEEELQALEQRICTEFKSAD